MTQGKRPKSRVIAVSHSTHLDPSQFWPLQLTHFTVSSTRMDKSVGGLETGQGIHTCCVHEEHWIPSTHVSAGSCGGPTATQHWEVQTGSTEHTSLLGLAKSLSSPYKGDPTSMYYFGEQLRKISDFNLWPIHNILWTESPEACTHTPQAFNYWSFCLGCISKIVL